MLQKRRNGEAERGETESPETAGGETPTLKGLFLEPRLISPSFYLQTSLITSKDQVTMSIHIRYGEEMDASILAGFQLRMAEETEHLQLEEEVVADGVIQLLRDRSKGFYLVAENDNEDVMGCLIITYEWSDWRNGWIWWIGSLFVEKIYRKHGIFRLLLDKVMDLAKDHEVRAIRLYVDKENDSARKAYLRSGFKGSNYEVFEYEKPIPQTPYPSSEEG
jgi:GNAT superfamily N-acetyltransferase